MAVGFADITGNKRADYLCIAKDGKVVGAVQDDEGSFEQVEQIKFAESADRANLRWADVNGDGKADMIWVDKFNGDGRVWYFQHLTPFLPYLLASSSLLPVSSSHPPPNSNSTLPAPLSVAWQRIEHAANRPQV